MWGNECKGIFGLLFGHRFKARYSTAEKERENDYDLKLSNGMFSTDQRAVMVAAYTPLTETTYEHDVCVRCGAVVNNEVPNVG